MIPARVRSILAYVAVFAAVGSIVSYLPLYYRSLGIPLGELGGMLALGPGVGLVAAPAWGSLSDRFRGSPWVLIAATATALAASAVLALAPDRPMVIVGAALLGAGMAGLSPILDARALETTGTDRSRYGPLRAWGSLSYIGSALGTGFAIEQWGIGSMWVALAVSLVATGLVGASLRPSAARIATQASAQPLRDTGRLFGPSGLGLFMLGVFVSWLGMSAVLSFTPLRFQELGAGATIVGLSGAIAAAIEVPIMLRFPSLSARFGSERLLVAATALLALRSLTSALATTPELLLATSIFGGIGFALFYVGGVTYVSQHVPRELAATAQGIFQGAGSSLSQVVAAGVGGSIAAAFRIDGLFLVAAGLGLIGTVTVAVAVRRGAAAGAVEPANLGSPTREDVP